MKRITYAIYNDIEYGAWIKSNHEILLISQSPHSLSFGFKEKRSGDFVAYQKVVSIDQIQSLFKRRQYAFYQGYQFNVEDTNKDEILITNCFSDSTVCKQLGMTRVDQSTYEMWIPSNKVEITTKIEEIK